MVLASYLQPDGQLDYANASGSAIVYNEIVVIDDIIGVSRADIPDADTGPVMTKGIFTLPASSGVTYTQGQKLYWGC